MNSWRRRKYESWLVPYADGTLDERRLIELERYLRHDPVLAADAEAQRLIAGRLRGAALAEDVGTKSETSRLWPQIQARIQPKRRSVATLIWAGGVCAAACLGGAALWGPLSETPQIPANRILPAVVLNGSVNPLPGANLPPPKSQGRSPKLRHVKSKAARHSEESGMSETPPAAPVERQEMASAEEGVTIATPSEASAPAPKPAIAASEAPQLRAAVGLQNYSQGATNSETTSDKPDQKRMDTEPPVSERGVSDPGSGNVTTSADASSDAVTRKIITAQVRKRHGRHHRRLHRHGKVLSPKTVPVSAQNSSPPVDDTPMPVHIHAKPVD